MKILIQLLLLLSFILLSSSSKAQDIHWSQFNDNPIFQSPSNAGHFKGDYRFVGNYRDQWRSVTVPFQTLALSADGRVEKYQNIGYGISFFQDVVGDGQFRTIELQGNVSYHLRLTTDSMHNIRLGANFGLNHRQFNADQFYFDNQFDGISYNPSLATGEAFQTDRKTNISAGIGATYQYYVNERFNFTGGVGAFNLNRPNQGFFEDVIRREIRLNIFGRGIYKLNYDFDLVPGINLSFQGKYREIVLGSSVKYTLINRLGEYRAVYAGLWWRNRDAAYVSVGMDYQSWFVGISYDVNFSKLVPASRTRGGIELAVRYILNHFKPKKVVHRICPDYI
ncbi:MAG: PorP/SprF family type IX secretion system membrane protein [Fluviicola sp.]|nr:PorP/SprF family type IX secretion system membrane protein [Fluviicola sp.]